MAALLGLLFLVGGILVINRALQFLWRPFIGADTARTRESSSD